jgi:hypothetical protein
VGVKAGILQSIKGEVYLEDKRLKLQSATPRCCPPSTMTS